MATRSSSAVESHRAVRKVRRMSQPLPYFPWGWILAAALLTLLCFGSWPFSLGWIQQPTERAAREALSEIGATWAVPEVSGQWVTVKGSPPSEAAADRALAAVRRSTASTWLGTYAPARVVRGEFTTPAAARGAVEPGLEWAFRLDGGVLQLQGEVPDDATRAALDAAANAAIDPPRITEVDNALVVTGDPLPPGFREVAARGIANVVECDLGVAELTCDRYSLLCEVPEARAEVVRTRATAPLPYGRIGTIQVLADEAVASCESALAEALSRSTIRFATERHEIDAASAPILDLVATTARECPGTLRIEGHTDSEGDAAFNDALSQRRAASVRSALIARGLPSNRLVAQGFGSRRPVADNRTERGRSQNRRIEIRVIRASD